MASTGSTFQLGKSFQKGISIHICLLIEFFGYLPQLLTFLWSSEILELWLETCPDSLKYSEYKIISGVNF